MLCFKKNQNDVVLINSNLKIEKNKKRAVVEVRTLAGTLKSDMACG